MWRSSYAPIHITPCSTGEISSILRSSSGRIRASSSAASRMQPCKQRVVMHRVGLVEAGQVAREAVDGSRLVAAHQVLVQRLQRKFACPAAGRLGGRLANAGGREAGARLAGGLGVSGHARVSSSWPFPRPPGLRRGPCRSGGRWPVPGFRWSGWRWRLAPGSPARCG
jgi:hypothetical protein